jgi:hypothetical protein
LPPRQRDDGPAARRGEHAPARRGGGMRPRARSRDGGRASPRRPVEARAAAAICARTDATVSEHDAALFDRLGVALPARSRVTMTRDGAVSRRAPWLAARARPIRRLDSPSARKTPGQAIDHRASTQWSARKLPPICD